MIFYNTLIINYKSGSICEFLLKILNQENKNLYHKIF